jgi:hypothetical protein
VVRISLLAVIKMHRPAVDSPSALLSGLQAPLRFLVRWLGILLAPVLALPASAAGQDAAAMVRAGDEISLDGKWEVGEGRRYERHVVVPGLAQDPARMSDEALWYRRSVILPEGAWTRATLVLNGARFAPAVFVDGDQVSSTEGGMAPTVHELKHQHVIPGRTIQLEVSLKSLRDLDPLDASATPVADRWRSNVSSALWDRVTVHFSGATRIARMIPWTDFQNKAIDLRWELDAAGRASGQRTVQAVVLDAAGKELAKSAAIKTDSLSGAVRIELGDACRPWTPDTPNLYHLRLSVSEAESLQDSRVITWGLRDFRTHDLRFQLNDAPIELRAGTVVWHRFLRDPEGRTLAFDPKWFAENIVSRLRTLGANTLRFHLGLPPEALLDLCDRAGLMVQLEWLFFHGIEASPESLRHQWRDWLDVAMRHPSVVLLHPWNETEGDQLTKARQALAAILPDYPPLVVSHRDVVHIHKYWWSLFENLGLYYDSAAEFNQPIMVDEFGGNYLDNNGGPGGYRTVQETLLRFLGREHTRELRLRHQAESNARVAEYWRQLGAAGFSPFCALGSPSDGNTWFLGPLADPQPKPVWAALSAAYSPESVSMAIWNRNFVPGQAIEFPLHFFNDRNESRHLRAVIRLVAGDGSERVCSTQNVEAVVGAHGTEVSSVRLEMPRETGEWRLEAELTNKVAGVAGPIKSAWRCRTITVVTPERLRGLAVGTPAAEGELREFLARRGLRVVGEDDPGARVLVFSAKSWAQLVKSPAYRSRLEAAVNRGQSIVLLDIGPTALDVYQAEARRNLEGAPVFKQFASEQHELFSGVEVVFRQASEPESHIHPAANSASLWQGLPRESTWLWNGLRGGLIVPPSEMAVIGLSSAAFLTLWGDRGADSNALSAGAACFAYELEGYYGFSDKPKDEAATARLREKVKFLAEDAPSLQGRINPSAPIKVTNLTQAFRETKQSAQASEVTPLASCGKNLTRVPAVMVGFGSGHGRIILSQLLTAGRLRPDMRPLKLYELGHDPAAEQLVLNMIALVSPAP